MSWYFNIHQLDKLLKPKFLLVWAISELMRNLNMMLNRVEHDKRYFTSVPDNIKTQGHIAFPQSALKRK